MKLTFFVFAAIGYRKHNHFGQAHPGFSLSAWKHNSWNTLQPSCYCSIRPIWCGGRSIADRIFRAPNEASKVLSKVPFSSQNHSPSLPAPFLRWFPFVWMQANDWCRHKGIEQSDWQEPVVSNHHFQQSQKPSAVWNDVAAAIQKIHGWQTDPIHHAIHRKPAIHRQYCLDRKLTDNKDLPAKETVALHLQLHPTAI